MTPKEVLEKALIRNKKVATEITLLAIAYNINKYHHKIQIIEPERNFTANFRLNRTKN